MTDEGMNDQPNFDESFASQASNTSRQSRGRISNLQAQADDSKRSLSRASSNSRRSTSNNAPIPASDSLHLSGINLSPSTLTNLKPRSRHSSMASSVLSMAQAAATSRSMVPYVGNLTSLTPAQVEGTFLLSRLHNVNVSRIVRLTSVTTTASLFQQCNNRWSEKQLGSKFRFLARFDEIDDYLEIVQSCSSDLADFMQLLKRQWADAGEADIIYVPVILLPEGVDIAEL
jgi:hypothetical protein